MSMAIIITMNIYISPANEERLRKHDGSMSGLVNHLLEQFFSQPARPMPTSRKDEALPSGGKKITLGVGDSTNQSNRKVRDVKVPEKDGARLIDAGLPATDQSQLKKRSKVYGPKKG